MSDAQPDSHSPDSYEVMSAPALRVSWLLRPAAIVAVLAALVGTLIAPGIHGTFSEAVVERLDALSLTLSYAMGILLVLSAMLGAWDVSRAPAVPVTARVAVISPALVVVGLFLPACAMRLPAIATAMLILASSSAAIVGALIGARAPHTRAAAVALGLFAFAALVRLLAWHLSNYAALHASIGTWWFARFVATLGLALDAAAQMVVTAWLGTRGRLAGQLSSALALAAAFAVVWASSRGGTASAEPWQAMLHLSLGGGSSPPHFGSTGITVFLQIAALALACAVLARLEMPAPITSVIALALVSHGSFDAPLRALAAVTASMWVMITMTDQRALWRAIGQKKPATG